MSKRNPNARGTPRQPIIGKRFGSLYVLAYIGNSQWFCRCDCGKYTATPRAYGLINGTTTTCGCGKGEKNGSHKHPEYRIWMGMKNRCYDPQSDVFNYYGGRGIKVCDRWLKSFSAFLGDMGKRPSPKHQINRINNDGDYEPSNCEWVLQSVNMRNTRTTRFLTHDGITLPLIEWAEKLHILPTTIRMRLSKGWSITDTLTIPIEYRKPQRRKS